MTELQVIATVTLTLFLVSGIAWAHARIDNLQQELRGLAVLEEAKQLRTELIELRDTLYEFTSETYTDHRWGDTP